MTRPLSIAIGLLAFAFLSACDFGSKCACTQMYCPDGLFIEYAHKAEDLERVKKYQLIVTLPGDQEISPDEFWLSDSAIEFHFTHRTLRKTRPATVGYAVLDEAGARREEGALTLAWSTRVCNQCSGSGSECTDEHTTHAKGMVEHLP